MKGDTIMNKPMYYNSEKHAATLRDLLEADEDTTKEFEKHFLEYGFDGFFTHLETLNVSEEMMQKVISVKAIMALSAKIGR